MTAEPNGYSRDCADTDASNIVQLLDIACEEISGLTRDGMTADQKTVLARIEAVSYVTRELAERLSEGVFGATKPA